MVSQFYIIYTCKQSYTCTYMYKCVYTHIHSAVARLFWETDYGKRNWQALRV